MIAVICRCSETNKLFGIRFDTKNGKKWEVEWAFPLKEGADKRGKGHTNPVNGSFDVGEEYSGCPNCGNPTFFLCSVCGKISCRDGETSHVVCANCDSEIYIDSPITEIRGDGSL